MRFTRQTGFTLIELMIVVVLIGVLSGIAYPIYQQYTQKSRRTDGKNALLQIAARQEQFYARCLRYASTLAGNFGDSCVDDGSSPNPGLGLNSVSKEENYNLSLLNVSVTYFQARATADSGKAQKNDTECYKLFLDSYGKKESQKKGSSTFDDKKLCW